MVRHVRPAALILAIALAACSTPAAPPTPTKTAAPAKATPTPESPATIGPSPDTPRPGPTGYATNRPSVSVSAGATPTPVPTPTPAATFGPIAAGYLLDGDDREPKDTPLAGLGDLEVADDGTLWVATRTRLYSLAEGGKLRLVGGAQRGPAPELDGKPASEAGFGPGTRNPLTIHRDGDGTTLLAYDHALAHLDAEGKLEVLWRGDADDAVAGIIPLADGKHQLLVRSGSDPATARYAWWSARPGAASIRLRAASEAEAGVLRAGAGEAHRLPAGGQGPLGVAQGGKLLVRALAGGAVTELDPGGAAPRAMGGGSYRPTHLDGRGKAYLYDQASGKLSRVTAASATAALVGNLPAGFALQAVASGADGTVFAAGHPASRPDLGRIYKLAGGGTEVVLGGAAPALGQPVGTAIRPTGVVALGPAELLVADALRDQILHVQAGKPVVALYGKPGGAELKEGGDATAAALAPTGLARDAEGRLYFLNGARELWRIDTKGQLARLHLDPTSGDAAQYSELAALAVAPTGDVLLGGLRGIKDGTLTAFLVHVDPKGVAKPVAAPADGERICGMATDPSGAVVFGLAPLPAAGDDARSLRLMRWTAEDGAKEAAAGSYREHPVGFGLLGADAKNRWYVLAGTGSGQVASIVRFDPADGTRALVAGPGAPRFAGASGDTSLLDVRGLSLLIGDAFVADGEQIKHLTGLAE